MTEPSQAAAHRANEATRGMVRPVAVAIDRAMEDARKLALVQVEEHILAGDIYPWLKKELERLP